MFKENEIIQIHTQIQVNVYDWCREYMYGQTSCRFEEKKMTKPKPKNLKNGYNFLG